MLEKFLNKDTMIQLRSVFSIFIVAVILFACKEQKKMRDAEPELLIGGDISLLNKLNNFGGVYKENNTEKDALEIFQNKGYNFARLRLFHTPNNEGATCQDLEYTIKLAKRIKKSGMQLLLNFHYSDTWADPGKQYKPKAWEKLTFEVLTDSVYQYTLKVMNRFSEEGITVDMVQPGNEITHGMLWPEGKLNGETEEQKSKQWDQFSALLNAGVKAIKDSKNGMKIPIMIHIASGGNVNTTKWFFDTLITYNVEYDIIGQSFYPWWHGTFEMLEENIQFMTENYKKDIIIVETAYHWKGAYPQGQEYSDDQPFPLTEHGQYDFLKNLYNICIKHESVKGLFYWYPESISVNQNANLPYFRRSLFKENGEPLKGLSAWE